MMASRPDVAPVVSRLFTRRISINPGMVRDYGVVLLLVGLFVFLSIDADNFLTVKNLKSLLDSSVAVGLIAAAGTVVIVAGGFDLSAGAIYLVASIIAVKVSNDSSPAIGIVVGVLTGCGLGLFNGLLCTVGRINPFVVTLGTLTGFAGVATLLSKSGVILIEDPSFANVANSELLGIRASTWILIGVALFCGFLLRYTIFGRHVFGRGGNIAAARLSGVPVNRTLTATYVLSGGVAAIAGVIVAARSSSVSPTNSNLIFEALAAILIGGNSVRGGEGAIWRTVVGVLLIATIANGFNLLGVDPLYQQVVSGGLILTAVGVDTWVRRRA